MADYKFLFDNNCEKAAGLFPGRRVVTLKQAGLKPNVTDTKIVEAACHNKWIIVTANGDDFISEIKKYLRQTKKKDCHDLSGLVILPSDHEAQRLSVRNVERRLMLNKKHIRWKDVWELDCCVRIMRATVRVTRFERCFYCKKREQK
jgi:Domain of unknown function (DUF5615)